MSSVWACRLTILRQKALKLIETAEVLAGGRRHLDYFASHQGERIVVGGDLTGALKAIQEAAASRRWWCWLRETLIITASAAG